MKRISNTSRRLKHLCCLAVITVASGAGIGVAKELPVLNWVERSDWLNVTRDVEPKAKGDGKADDTAAIQAALDKIKIANWEGGGPVGGPKTVYLPPGTYRITAPLHLRNTSGAMFVGHGRSTRIVWGGGTNECMFWSDGGRHCRYIGIVWDGQGKVENGFDHSARVSTKSWYETENIHQYEEFVNFSGCGIRFGVYRLPTWASDQTPVENCIFRNCGKGISADEFNYYHYPISGCEFYDCGTGVFFNRGMGYVRNSHFERSKEQDLFFRLGHPVNCSVRRTTSIGSKRFLTCSGAGWTGAADVQDCRVQGWTDPDGAIVANDAGTILIYDTVFTQPPSTNPPIKLANAIPDYKILLTVSCNSSPETKGLVDPGPNSSIVEIPAGKRKGLLTSANQSFFREKVELPGKVFDAKRDFAAKGDGKTDDTAAIQAAIDAARKAGHGAMAYLPTGKYNVTNTLHITGANYCVGGSGMQEGSDLVWGGPTNSVLFRVHDPQNVKMEYLQVTGTERGKHKGTCAIQQTSSGKGSFMRYEGVAVPGPFLQYSPRPRGFEFVGLGKDDVVRCQGNTDGDMRLTNCGRATILIDSLTASPLVVEGTEKVRDGFVAFHAFMGLTAGDPVIHVKDNQNLVIGDIYMEQTPGKHVLVEGNPGDPSGYVTLMSSERYTGVTGCKTNPSLIVAVNNYQGRYFEGRGMFDYPPAGGYRIVHTGDRPVDIIFLADTWMTLHKGPADQPHFTDEPVFEFGKGGRMIRLQNMIFDLQGADKVGDRLLVGSYPERIPNIVPPGGLERVAEALDDLRRLGEVDLMLHRKTE